MTIFRLNTTRLLATSLTVLSIGCEGDATVPEVTTAKSAATRLMDPQITSEDSATRP